MSYLFDRHQVRNIMAPQEVAMSGNVTSTFVDTQSVDGFCFSVFTGAIAQEKGVKGVKVELLSSTESGGGSPEVEGDVTFTAPSGGVTNHSIYVCGDVSALRGRYLGIRVSNLDDAAAIQAGAAVILESAYRPQDADGTLLVV